MSIESAIAARPVFTLPALWTIFLLSAKSTMATAAAKCKLKKVTVISQKQKVFHAPNPVLSVLMWGVNHNMAELECVAPQPLVLANDFKAFSKTSIHNSAYNECGRGTRVCRHGAPANHCRRCLQRRAAEQV